MEKDFFAVLNNRMGRRPVFMTGNSDGEEIEYRFKLGEPLVRRIRDHCLSIHFGKNDITNNQKRNDNGNLPLSGL
jgi:DNA replication protein DnaC